MEQSSDSGKIPFKIVIFLSEMDFFLRVRVDSKRVRKDEGIF